MNYDGSRDEKGGGKLGENFEGIPERITLKSSRVGVYITRLGHFFL